MKENLIATAAICASLPLIAAKTPSGVAIPDVPQTVTELTIEPGEGWWGLGTVFGSRLSAPFGAESRDFSYDNRRHAYGNQTAPFLVSTHGRYVWCEGGFTAALQKGKLTLSSDGQPFVVAQGGSTLRDAYLAAAARHFPASGKRPPAEFFCAPQYNTWIELGLSQSQEGVLKYARDIIAHGFEPGVLMIDDTWQLDYGTWEFDPRTFPNPKAMCEELHRLGFKVMLWICPFVSMDSREFRLLESKGGLLRDGLKRPAAIRWWNGVSAVLDFDKESDVSWFEQQLSRLQKDFGIDGFKFDAGDTGYYDVADQRLPQLTREAEGDLNRHNRNWSKLAEKFPYNEMRASWKSGNRPLVQRLGDKGADFGAVSILIPDMISAGLLGYGFVCPDMVGGGAYDAFHGGAFDAEAFIRSAQVHALAPMMQFSAAPWRVLSEEDFKIIQKLVAIRAQFKDYYLDLADKCAETGEPMLRAMDYQFPGCGYESIADQFMMGDRLLVAPQVKKGATTREVVLPAGEWTADDGNVVKGPVRIMVETPLARLPYFQRR